ncbi:hypothetical protein C488_13398 [Natrinema pellirubrum DSM 15624]|uniref:DUF8119 domain-containing protein n=1 Tax=Natrinema pellirubrum (strain DSM 15624 / CIP 106293 / JCM 10476 / NCIMB 786 / 157) TaxID=797303 RepID=L0JN23_NATP1|nr:hypothetical protein [Natrinema pellirubrum]AGB32664.1 hypothetical protein Natpe_2866 [Natrinema pellirubrum DSM 15624]ELY73798.1 hypothetical protein C488_13398 [Natrinema pellirubrum DSM 15624]
MRNDTSRSEEGATGPVRTAVRTIGRVVGDLIAISLWVLFLTLAFLATGWPRWAFYALLLVGVGVYVAVTAAWLD